MEDPYYRFQEEVEEEVVNIEQQTREFEVLRSSPQSAQRAEWVKGEIQGKIDPIRKQLVDIEKMNAAVLANPTKFNIAPSEIDNRRAFVSKTRNRIGQVEARLNAPPPDTPEMRAAAKKDRLTRAKINENQNAIDGEIQRQQVQLQRQDADLDAIGNDVATIGNIANLINDELKDQNQRLSEVNDHLDNSNAKLGTTTQKMQKLLSSKTTWMSVYVFDG